MAIKLTTITRDELFGHASNAQELAPKKAEETKTMVGRRGKRTTSESEAMIKNFILKAKKPVTMLQICDHIGRAPAPHFRAMVNRMVAAGIVDKFESVSEGGNLPRYLYWRPGR